MRTTPPKPLVVEFFGLPGSGKTTVTNSLRSHLSESGWAVATRADVDAHSKALGRGKKFWLLIRYAASLLPMIVRGFVFSYSAHVLDAPTIVRLLKAPWIDICLKHFLAKNGHYDFVLLDQAAIQNTWSIVAFSAGVPSAGSMRAYLRAVLGNGTSHLYVHISATPELASQRIDGRGDACSRFDLLEHVQRCVVLGNAQFVMQALAELLKKDNNRILVLDAADSVEQKTGLVLNAVRDWAGSKEMRCPRVLMALPGYPYPVVGGLERQAHELSRTLMQSGLSVSVISTKFCRTDKDIALVDGVVVRRLPYSRSSVMRFVQLPLMLFAVFFRIRNQIDVVHVHQYSWFGLFTIIVAKMLGKPVITKLPNVGERGIPGLSKGLLGRIRISILKSSDAIVAMSEQSLVELQEIGFPLARTLMTPNGIRLDAPFRTAASTLGGQRVNVVCVGRLTPQKGIENLLYAWHAVSRLEPSAVLKIWGDGESRKELEGLADRLRIQQSVQFCGYVNDVPAKLPDMDIFVLPSYIEGNSNAILEAMRAGLPIVATRVGGTEMQVGPEGVDFLVNPGCPDEIASRLVMLIRDSSLRSRLGQAMRNRVSHFFDIQLVADTYRQAYVLLTEGKRDQLIELGNPVIRGVDELSDQPL